MKRIRACGQAVHFNRPHLVESGFLTPNITPKEYVDRRRNLLKLMAPNSLAIIGGNTIQYATPSVFHKFRQDPNFQYLTGFLEPDSTLLVHKPANSDSNHSMALEMLLVPEKDEFSEKWEGERTGTQLATDLFGVPAVSNTHLRETVRSFLGSVEHVYADIDPKTTIRQGTFYNHELPGLVHSKLHKTSLTHLVMQLRQFKSEAEIDCLRTACEISSVAYNQAYSQQFFSEHQLHAYLDFMFRQGGCDVDAYLAVVAGGDHALTIHYVRNDDTLRSGDLVLVDAGGRFGGYCADISRTWPVNGKFSGAQRDLYEAVLATEKECINQCCESKDLSLYDIHHFSESQLKQNLKNIGLDLSYSQLGTVYPHMIGHQLGLDVHDISIPGANNKPLKRNQVITIEPGVYIPRSDDYPKHFQGIGIRIEDNVVIGESEGEILTIDCLKEIHDLER